tara:strand:+ start:105 stop:3314 length:3210 start_codon:yes stop_codon:yes gene_type:complete
MELKKIMLLIVLLPVMVLSQSKTVTGLITDENNVPLPGATIQLSGSDSVGAITDFDGNFSITIPSDAEQILIVSYIGYIEERVDVSNQIEINVSLAPDTEALEEVVVIGYGTVLKRDLTGSVSSVKVEDEVSRQASTVDQLLQGRATGVQVTQNSGNPNSGISVRIRGTNSLRGNNEPLYVVDGVIISSAGEDVMQVDDPDGQGNTGQDPQSGLNGINPRDIESIEVLKDASATAIYGSRGANGVVLITTKSGSEENAGKINAYVSTSFTDISKKLDVLDPFGYAEYRNAYQDVLGNNHRFFVDGDQIYRFQLDDDGNPTETPESDPQILNNWQDEVYEQGISTNFGVSMTGANDSGNYYLSVGANDMKGVVKSSSFKTSDIRFNLNYDLSEKLRLEGRFSAFLSDSNFAEGGDKIGGDGSFVQQTVVYTPILDNNFFQEQRDSGRSNPMTFIDDFTDESKENRFLASLALKYKFNVPGLQYEFRIGGNQRDKTRNRFYGLTTFVGYNTTGLFQQMKLSALSYQVNNFLRYNKSNRTHRVNATLGVTYDVRDVENSRYATEDFITPVLGTLQPFLGQVISQPLIVAANDTKIFSVLGRLNYTFKNKYVLTASFRRDGVSKFSDDLKYGIFPSFAMAWRAGSEKFIQNLNVFSSLKLRAGWGQIGNHGVGPYGTISNYGGSSLYGSSSNNTVVPVYLTNLANRLLTWEKTEQLNIGLDFGFLNGKISGTIDVYDKITKDLLQRAPVSPSSGFSEALVNRGEMSNKGLEVGLDFAVLDSDDIGLSLGGNISVNKTEIGNLGLPSSEIFIPDSENPDLYNAVNKVYYLGNQASRGQAIKFPINIFMSGYETGLFYGWKTDGIFQDGDTVYKWLRSNGADSQPGDIKVVDLNGDGVIDLEDRTIIGNPNPDFIYSFNLNFRIKDFSISALFNGVQGNDIANLNSYRYGWAEGTSRNIIAESWTNRWSADNPAGTYPRLGFKTVLYPAMMDYVIEDGSYLRLNNLTVNYDIPVNSKTISSANVYVTGQNLFTWTNYSGYDPEVTSFMYDGLMVGVDWNNKPNARTFLVGVNFTF